MDAPKQAEAETVELTPEVIQRVQEGLAAARDVHVQTQTQTALNNISAIARGDSDLRVSGRFRHWLLRRFIRFLFRIEVENPENIPQEPVVLVANHLSHLDPFLVLAAVPPHPYYYILGDARTLYNKRWKRWIVGSAGGVIPLERWWKEEIAVIERSQTVRPDLKDLAQAIQADVPNGSSIQQMRQIDQAVQAILKRGDGLMLFPEGRLGHQEGQLHLPLKRGTVIYAIRSGVPIVPVAIIGSKTLHFRKKLTLRFGEPLPFSQNTRPKRKELEEATAQVEQALSHLLVADYKEPKGAKPLTKQLNQLFW
ncbi:lysophospholipid acyltransferase family protein [Oscillatoria sp. CS-180]|uniref:lysophospholipid acyltransferase family protein n=1 Tax=Oscillatoria sp. CS-180 TaxID=3021720 RepID=UPI00232BA746|nr:lysophospholipid acyltransferase family protein [Oscillatoria sp. CS-180]MDB9525487.1 lysophospholipid acyltransferase family protein [Oscillatoria sp. CS-180]